MPNDAFPPDNVPPIVEERSTMLINWLKTHINSKDYPDGVVGVDVAFSFSDGLVVVIRGGPPTTESGATFVTNPSKLTN